MTTNENITSAPAPTKIPLPTGPQRSRTAAGVSIRHSAADAAHMANDGMLRPAAGVLTTTRRA